MASSTGIAPALYRLPCLKTVKQGEHKLERRVKLVMPTTILAQDGAVIQQNTRIAVHGCKAGGARGKVRSHRR